MSDSPSPASTPMTAVSRAGACRAGLTRCVTLVSDKHVQCDQLLGAQHGLRVKALRLCHLIWFERFGVTRWFGSGTDSALLRGAWLASNDAVVLDIRNVDPRSSCLTV